MSVAGQHAQPNGQPNAPQNVVEAYAFACLNCGYGWEQEYEIAHRTDASGRPVVTYLVDGVKVPSPLTRPTCQNCEGHLLRIMRSGQVADVVSHHPDEPPAPPAAPRHSALGFLHRRHGSAGQEEQEGHEGNEEQEGNEEHGEHREPEPPEPPEPPAPPE